MPLDVRVGKSRAPVSAVLFDLDGTLLDAYHSHYRVFAQVFRDLARELDEAAYVRCYSPNWYVFYERLNVPKELWPEADRLWLRYYAQEVPAQRDGADDLLRAIQTAGGLMGLVTSGDRSRVERDLDRMGWERTFQVVVCGGDVLERKPHPAALQHALRHLAVPPSKALYIGDTAEDVMMGKAAGVMTAAVLGGFSPREAFQSVPPNFSLDSLRDMMGLFV